MRHKLRCYIPKKILSKLTTPIHNPQREKAQTGKIDA